MNANELADSIATCEPNLGRIATDCADMIRQQQEQINNLKQWEKRQLDVIEALKVDNKQLTEWLTKVGFVK